MYKDLSAMEVHKKGLWSKVVVPKKHFFFEFTVFNCRELFFPAVSFSHESSCGHPLLNGYCIYFRRALASMNCVYTVYLTVIFI